MKTRILTLAAAAAAVSIFAGCSTSNPVAEQSPEQTGAAYNMPMQTDATGATQKHTATRNLNNQGVATYQLLPNGAMVPIVTFDQGMNSDFAALAAKGVTIEQGLSVPVKLGGGEEFQGPFGQKITINEVDKSNTDGYAEQLQASMGGQNQRLSEVANVVKTTYEGKALVVGAYYDGVAKVGDKVKEISGPILEAFSPYAAAGGAIKQVVTVFDEKTGEKTTVVADVTDS
ncbi:hypothetical protein [Cerasicoccus frondis]|uniref:hypothetical protein n=1 Tax=Cerasicoccus frondis TaxID=490090 RepID=UPI002852969B|nr:hypothetical protein [Cerasicoccus frondis]